MPKAAHLGPVNPMAREKMQGTAEAPMRVAEYVRMSSEHQQYSTFNQSAAIEAYATSNLMTVVRSYRDEGRSGLRLDDRHALKALLCDVRAGNCGFEAVLVLDVSRWGRFQNADEAAYHEFVCHLGGVRVIYVAEPFPNDGSPLSSVLKGLKRAMAAEYSRELSGKVFAGQCRLISLGYRQGGSAGYGLRRMRVDAQGHHLGILKRGERKSLVTDRVILVPGPDAEVAVVQSIFRDFLSGLGEAQIAKRLNACSVLNTDGKPWERHQVFKVLSSEKYTGENIFGKTKGQLRQRRKRNQEDQWIRRKAAFEPVVSQQTFAKAKERIRLRSRPLTEEEALAPLKRILLREGRLSTRLIEQEPDALSIPALVRRFGGLRHIYSRLGFDADKNLSYVDVRFRLRDMRASIMEQVIEVLLTQGAIAVRQGMQLYVDDAWTVSVTVVQASFYRNRIRWYVRQRPENSDIVVYVRMSGDGTFIEDYVVAPRLILDAHPRELSPDGFRDVASYTYSSLSILGYLERAGGLAQAGRIVEKDDINVPKDAIAGTAEACNRLMTLVQTAAEVLHAFPGQLPLVWQRFQGPEDGRQKRAPASDGETLLGMVVLRGRVASLMAQAPLVGWLARHHPRELAVFQAAAELDGVQGSLFQA